MNSTLASKISSFCVTNLGSCVLYLFLTVFVTACAVNPVTGKSDFVLMSENAEIKLGRDSNQKIIEQFGGVYNDQELQEYIQRIGESLATNSHRSNLIYRFTLLDTPTVNAFALPGGYIYITRGLLAYLNSEAELAAVLGHEIGHVTARHSVRQISTARAADLGFTIGAIFVPELQTSVAQNLYNVLGSAIISGYGRDHELESDRLGALYLARSGYNPNAMIKVIGVLKDQEVFERQLAGEEGREPRIYHGVFASHPDNDERLQVVVKSAESLKSSVSSKTKPKEFLEKLDGLVFGDSESAGIVRDHSFYHKGLGIVLNFPEHWKIENSPNRLLAQPRNGEAMLQVVVEEINKRISPEEFMHDRLKLKGLKQGQDINLDGLKGHTALSRVRTPFGKRDTRFSVIFFNEQAFIFIGAAKNDNSPGDYDKDFIATVNSFHAISDKERSLATALKIKLKRMKGKSRYADLASKSEIASHAEEQLRLLNGHYPTGEPKQGQLVKTIH